MNSKLDYFHIILTEKSNFYDFVTHVKSINNHYALSAPFQVLYKAKKWFWHQCLKRTLSCLVPDCRFYSSKACAIIFYLHCIIGCHKYRFADISEWISLKYFANIESNLKYLSCGPQFYFRCLHVISCWTLNLRSCDATVRSNLAH